MASIALLAENVAVTAARAADADLVQLEPLDDLLQLAALVQPSNLVGAADVPPGDEHPREGQVLGGAEDPVELGEEPGVHGEISLVDGDAEAAEDGSDGSAVVVGPADDAERGGVEDDTVVGAGESNRLRRRKAVGGGGPVAEDGGGEADPAEEGMLAGAGEDLFGFVVVVVDEGQDVLEGGA